MRPALLHQCVRLSLTFVDISHHIPFREHGCFNLCTAFEQTAAQQREFLKGDSVPANQIEIRAHCNVLPTSPLSDGIEMILPDIIELLEAS
jgi:hypothetical protein